MVYEPWQAQESRDRRELDPMRSPLELKNGRPYAAGGSKQSPVSDPLVDFGDVECLHCMDLVHRAAIVIPCGHGPFCAHCVDMLQEVAHKPLDPARKSRDATCPQCTLPFKGSREGELVECQHIESGLRAYSGIHIPRP